MADLQMRLISLASSVEGPEVDSTMRFVTLDPELLADKSERHSYDTYVPKGVMKAQWVYKHQHVIPSVVCILVEWGDDAEWRTQENALVQYVAVVKGKVRPRGTRILIVLVQQRKGIPGELSAEDRMQSFRKRADLDTKSLLILPAFDLKSGIYRFVHTVSQAAEAYYKDAGRRVKKAREHVGRHRGHHALDVRLNFKIGFFAEIRGDVRAALKYYKRAYEDVVDTPRTHERMDEIKAVADWVNYKVCRVLFRAISVGIATTTAQDVILQFRRHISVFRNAIGPQDREHCHMAWLAQQYKVFGELLDSVPHLIAMSASRYQNSAFYYMASATACKKRRAAAGVVCGGVDKLQPVADAPPHPQIQALLGHIDGQEYLGVPPANAEHVSMAEAEARVDHSGLAIEMLTRAHEQYKRSASARRMTLCIAYQIAEAFFESGDFAMSRRFFSKIARTYRKEGWLSVLTAVLEKDLVCARRLGLWREFISLSLELLAAKMPITPNERCEVHRDMMSALHAPESAEFAEQPPVEFNVAEGHVLGEVVSCCVAFQHAAVVVKGETSVVVTISINMPLPIRFNKFEVAFSDPMHTTSIHDCDGGALLDHADEPQQRTDDAFVAGGEEPRSSSLVFRPAQPRRFSFTLSPQSVGQLECLSVRLVLGRDGDERLIAFVWRPAEAAASPAAIATGGYGSRTRLLSSGADDLVAEAALAVAEAEAEARHHKQAPSSPGPSFVASHHFTESDARPVLLVSAPASSLQCVMHHAAPAVVNELCAVRVEVDSEALGVSDGVMTLSLVCEVPDTGGDSVSGAGAGGGEGDGEFGDGSGGITTADVELVPIDGTASLASTVSATLGLPSMGPNTTHEVVIGVRSVAPGSCAMVAQITYTTPEHTGCVLVRRFPLRFVPALQLRVVHHTSTLQPVGVPQDAWIRTPAMDDDAHHATAQAPPLIAAHQVHTAMLELECRTPYPIHITGVRVHPSPSVSVSRPEEPLVPRGGLSRLVLNQAEHAALSFMYSVESPAESVVPLGGVELTLTRGESSQPFTTSFILAPVRVKTIALRIVFDTPTHARLGVPFPISVHVYNDGTHLSELKTSVRESSAFLYSGFKQWRFSVAPHSSRVIRYNVVPLVAGEAVLPHISISPAKEGAGPLYETVEPDRITVLPSS